MNRNLRKRNRQRRKGVAVVEFAICLPVIVVLVLGSIEACTMIFVKQSLHIAAYEAIRVGIRQDSDSNLALDRGNQILNERNIKQGTIDFDPTQVADALRGEDVTVTVTAPTDANSVMKLNFFSGNLDAQAVMIKE